MSRLNSTELAMMQSPSRAFSQRHVEMPAFRRMARRAGVDLTGARILDAGCGSGLGLALIAETYRPSRLVGIDLMPEQVERAIARGVPGAEIRVGDITAIDEPDASFDAVFVFGILHHVPAWRAALRELARVLRPGGILLVEEIHGRFVDIEDRLLGTSHPIEARFDWPTFRDGLARAGLAIRDETALVPGAVRSFAATKTVEV
jgi:ubiquinone/menaquinone biosynthesis C-methylase UbiE